MINKITNKLMNFMKKMPLNTTHTPPFKGLEQATLIGEAYF